MNIDPLQQEKQKVSDLIDDMIEILSVADPHHKAIIKQLTTILDVLLTQEHNVEGVKKSLLEYALGDIEVPSILSVNEVIENAYKYSKKEVFENLVKMSTATMPTSPLSTIGGLYKIIHTAHSLVVYNGLPKISVKINERTTLKVFLNTNIMMVKHPENDKRLRFSVAEVITLIRNKEVAHYDGKAYSNPNDKFYVLSSLEDRHFVILGIAEYIIATYQLLRGECKNWVAIENFPEHITFHIRRYSSYPLGICTPFILTYIDNRLPLLTIPRFQLFRKLKKGESFKICQISDKAWILVNDKHQLVLWVHGEDDTVIENQVDCALSEEESEKNETIKSYIDTARLLGIWDKGESSIEVVNKAEKNLTNISASLHIKLLWIKAEVLHNLDHRDEALSCYLELFEALNSIDPDQSDLSNDCHRDIGDCLFSIVKIYLSQNKPDNAIYFLEKLVELYGHLTKGKIVHSDLCQMAAQALALLSKIYMDKGDKVNAKKVLENLATIPKVTTQIAEWKKIAESLLAQLKNEG